MRERDDDDQNLSELDAATTRRLVRLRTMPVDTTRLEARLRHKIPGPAVAAPTTATAPRRMTSSWPARQPAPPWKRPWLRPLTAAAAAVLVIVLAIAVLPSAHPVMASVAMMAQVHQDMISGRTPAKHVDSIESANQMLVAESPGSPGLPAVPREHVMSCCLRTLEHKQFACVLLESEGVPVTMVVARGSEVKSPTSPTSPTQTRDGVTYQVQRTGALNMLMAKRDGRWICLIAELPPERLIGISETLHF